MSIWNQQLAHLASIISPTTARPDNALPTLSSFSNTVTTGNEDVPEINALPLNAAIGGAFTGATRSGVHDLTNGINCFGVGVCYDCRALSRPVPLLYNIAAGWEEGDCRVRGGYINVGYWPMTQLGFTAFSHTVPPNASYITLGPGPASQAEPTNFERYEPYQTLDRRLTFRGYCEGEGEIVRGPVGGLAQHQGIIELNPLQFDYLAIASMIYIFADGTRKPIRNVHTRVSTRVVLSNIDTDPTLDGKIVRDPIC